jgi:hypothetical protein
MREDRLQFVAVKEGDARLPVDGGELPPAMVGCRPGHGGDRIGRRSSRREQIEHLRAEARIGAMLGEAAPHPARANEQRPPTAMLDVVTAAPNMPERSQ